MLEGWVAYSITALINAIGENKLLPAPDCQCVVITIRSGYARANASWVIGRIVRDYSYWQDQAVKNKTAAVVEDKRTQLADQLKKKGKSTADIERAKQDIKQAGLVLSVYDVVDTVKPGLPIQDWVYWSGAAVSLLQLGIAAIPCGKYGDWSILMVAAAGTLLAYSTGSIDQWQAEKWACRRNGKDYVLTTGNGAQHAILIRGNGKSLNLEDLASGQLPVGKSAGLPTRLFLAVLALLWILLLVTASGLTQNSWYLLAVGGIGILHNATVAGWPRRPSAFGLHLHFHEVIGNFQVMQALYAVEQQYHRVGDSMVSTFFPGKLSHDEEIEWERLRSITALKNETQQGVPSKMGQTGSNREILFSSS